MYDIGTGIETPITADPENQKFPSIDGNRVVWEDERDESQNIYLYDISTGITTQITSDLTPQYSPHIDGDRVVWWAYSDREEHGRWIEPNIYMADLSENLPVADAGGPYSGRVGPPIAMDGRGSADPDGSIVSYTWDFGDGTTGTGATVWHAYASAGSFDVTLTVADNDGLAGTATVSVSVLPPLAPIAAFEANVTEGKAPLAVQFQDTSSEGPVTRWAWTFGDGATSTLQHPIHTYTAVGRYTVALNVSNSDWEDSVARNEYITVKQPVVPVPTGVGDPTDSDADELYDDVNGNGRADFADVVLYFNWIGWIAANEPLAAFDYNSNGRCDFADVVWLFNNL